MLGFTILFVDSSFLSGRERSRANSRFSQPVLSEELGQAISRSCHLPSRLYCHGRDPAPDASGVGAVSSEAVCLHVSGKRPTGEQKRFLLFLCPRLSLR